MKKYKLLKDLPYAEAGLEVLIKVIQPSMLPITHYMINVLHPLKIAYEWPLEWGDPRESDWFEKVEPKRCDCNCCEHEGYVA